MASSRSASPASRGASPEPLTPRSKIKALLATVDSSDDENGTASTKKTRATAAEINRLGSLAAITKRSARKQSADSEDDDSDVEVRPRGRLASRMQGVTAASESPEKVGRDVPDQTGADAPQNQHLTRDQPEEDAAVDAGTDEDELPVGPRRLKRRAPRKSTPAAAEESERSPSPGLFVSSPAKPSPTKSATQNSDAENDLPTLKSDRFKALVERKRQERLEREAAEEAVRAERRARQEKLSSELDQLDSDDDDVSDIEDDEGGRRLTQEARPTRKASRKAIEEMNRETQRMQRNMQLAHEAKTKNRVTTARLFELFNYKPAGVMQPEPKTSSSSRPGTPQSDVDMGDAETPPSSPPKERKQQAEEAVRDSNAVVADADEDELTAVDELMASSNANEKGKGKAIAPDVQEVVTLSTKPKRQVRVRIPVVRMNVASIESDDELQVITTAKDKINAVFDSLPAQKAKQPHSLQALRALAQVKSPGKDVSQKKAQTQLTSGELYAKLHQRARQQAKLERDRRLHMLKAQGVVVQTAEERERQMQEVEDIVAKAREEAQKIMELERAESKTDDKDQAADPLAWDDSEDDDYRGSADEADAELSAVELSGSDEEQNEDGDDEGEGNSLLFDEEASDAESDASESNPMAMEEKAESDDEQELPIMKQRRARKQVAILSDDESDAGVKATPKPKSTLHMSPAAPSTESPAAPMSVLRSAKKTFIPGLPVDGPAGLGLTQIFAGTMDDSQMSQAAGPTQSMMPDFDNFPDSNFSATNEEAADDMVVDSQKETQKNTQAVQLDLSQSQMHGLDSLLRNETNSQISEMVEPSQDGGLQDHTPMRDRFIEPPFSTVETVLAEQQDAAAHDSPLVRRGRLRRRMDPSVSETEAVPASTEKTQTAFSVLNQGAAAEKKKQITEDYDRKKSKAKEMVQEQAEESEDEYAGIGGADGEDSDDESAASMNGMIDDAAGNDIDEGKLAAFYADRERANDEKEVEKLFKDITTGMLRRKRGADYDLSDSDDDGEARRRMKRRQFAKMQQALFADERVKKMAENPGNQAFLRTIEDRGSDDEMDILVTGESQSQDESQSQPQGNDESSRAVVADSQPRRPLVDAGENNRAPAHLRRTKDGKKPSNLGEIRETLSSMLDEPQGSVIPATEAGSDSEDEQASPPRSDKENDAPNPRRGRGAVVVVDRLSAKRNASSASSSSTRLAFASASASGSSFKVPSLLRRATTNSFASAPASSTTSSSTGNGGSSGGFGGEAKIKKTASKRSAVNAFARENERRAKIQESERRRQEKRAKGAERRVGVVGGLLGKGSFE